MKVKSKRCVILLFLFCLGVVFLNVDSFNCQLNDQSFKKSVESKDNYTNFKTDQIEASFGGYNSSSDVKFEVTENASSRIDNRDFIAIEGNYFQQATPLNWNVNSMQFNIESYSKEQKISDSTFDIEEDLSPWYYESFEIGKGDFTHSFEPNNEDPDYVRTTIYNSQYRLWGDPGFGEGSYALWGQDLNNINPDNLDIQTGKVFQTKDQSFENFNNFQTDPYFYKDTETPYGGEYDPVWDLVDLFYDDVAEALRVIILPDEYSVGGNPSAAWWYYLYTPYVVDYAEMKISWSIDDDSTFESKDGYEVKARINDEFIDGTKWISKTGYVPFNGSSDALMVYTNNNILGHISHDTISRTYNITDLINGLVGINKFDFGIWAKNPSHSGDDDLISAKFESVEFMFNTSAKNEVASLEFDYKCIDEDSKGENPFLFDNDASIFLALHNYSLVKYIRVVPFSMMTISSSSFSSTPWTHVEFSISEQFVDLLRSNDLSFKIGIIFEDDYFDRIYYRVYFDNVFFNINYKHPSTNYSNLKIEVNNSGIWNTVDNNTININTTSWSGGELLDFQFKTDLVKYQGILYLNFRAELNVSQIHYNSSGASVSYNINNANSNIGIWNITYNNILSYDNLLIANSTPHFNFSFYSISYINLPSFDSMGSKSQNWEVYSAITPNFLNHTQYIRRYNSTLGLNYQNSRLTNTFQSGNWTLQAKQSNYITDCSFNSTKSYLDAPAYYKNEVLEYNFTLLEGTIKGNYSLSLLNRSGSIVGDFPKYHASNSKNVIGTLDNLEIYKVGQYFLYLKWNDTAENQGKTLRFGSNIKEFYIINATTADFISQETLVSPGDIANFTIFYRTYTNWGIENASIHVFENSSGYWRLWGKTWTGTYQIGSITYLGDGNYTIPLLTAGAPNGTYSLMFTLFKEFHQSRKLFTAMDIIAINILEINIVEGAYLNPFSQYVINDNNIPFVNDTINSQIQINITDQATKNPITGGLVLGTIGDTENYFEGRELGNGLYNLTLDTTGLNATNTGQNETLFIKCSASDYNIEEINVTIFIDKIPTAITLQNVDPVYAEGEITIYATMLKVIDPENPKPNNHGTLEYFIYQGASQKLSGSLNLLMSGVYSKEISLTSLSAGPYSIYINGTAFNCEDSQSNLVNFTILPQQPTELDINVPNTIRILKEFEIRTTLMYSINGSTIAFATIMLNITIGSENFLVNTITGSDGVSIYEYIISSEYEGQNITIRAVYEGQEEIARSEASVNKLIQGKIPVILEMIEFPNNTARVGYSATFRVRMDIKDIEETLQNRIILFSSYYDDESSPFITQQLYTDENGECGYTISEIVEGKDNFTTYFEFLGSTTIAYNSTSRTEIILPKWNSDFNYNILDEDGDGSYRYGEKITFNMTFWSSDIGAPSFSGLPVVFTFNYDLFPVVLTQFVTGNNTLWFPFSIPNSFSSNYLNITIDFQGSNKVNNKTLSFFINVEDKITANIAFDVSPASRYILGKYAISVILTTSGGNPLTNVKLIFKLSDGSGNLIDSDSGTTNDEGIATVNLDFKKEGNNYYITVEIDEILHGYYESLVLESNKIKITTELMAFFEDYGMIILISALVVTAISLILTYGYIKPKSRRKRQNLKQMYQKLSDIENIQYCLILTKDGGVPVFSKSLAEVPIDETLISGFLSAISSFGAEIGSKMQKIDGGLEELSYRQFKIILNEGKYVRVALLLLRRPHESLKAKLKTFNDVFEEKFEERLRNFTGEVLDEIQVTKLMEEVFEADLLYPHQLIQNKAENYLNGLSRKNIAKKIIIIAQSEEFESTFYLRDMINHLKTTGLEEVKSFESLQKLKEDKIVFAINPRTNYLIEQFQYYINSMDKDDRNVLFAIFEGNNDENHINKYLKKRHVELSKEVNQILEKLRNLEVIDDYNTINDTGNIVATLLKLIPDL
ncbi:MAG: Ig-like domain-containing protein [Candidatus Hodarchaeota archaeon]